MNRRLFIQSTAAAAATPLLALEQVAERVDVNFAIGPWPFRDLPKLDGDSLKQRGITQAITGSLEALLTRDIAAVNARLAEACAKSAGLLLPAGTLHPLLPAWREDLRRCRDEHGMKVIRLHPNYHGYTLADPIFAEMHDAITEAGLAVQIVAQMEDQRTQHPLVQAAPVDLKPLHEVKAILGGENSESIPLELGELFNFLDQQRLGRMGRGREVVRSQPFQLAPLKNRAA